MSTAGLSRRNFIKYAGISGGGLVMGLSLSGCSSAPPYPIKGQSFHPNAFLQITPDNKVHFYLPRNEMGQGAYSGLATLVAEELEVQLELIEIHQAPAHEDYVNTEYDVQATGGSTSMRISYYPLRQAAANAREAIRNAAAKVLNVPASTLVMQNGSVQLKDKHYPYGEFVTLANTMDVPDETPLKKVSEFKVIGRDRPRLDGVSKSTGTAEFGLDIDIPNLHKAVVVRCPVYGGTPKQFNANTVSTIPGVVAVVSIYNGVAIVATSYWQARKAAEKLDIEWELPELAKRSSDDIYQEFKTAMVEDEGEEAELTEDGLEALERADKVIEAEYWAPYLAHATMEPMNCTIRIQEGQCDIWVGSQNPEFVKITAALYADIDQDDIQVHSTFLGGGFGRRGSVDFVAETASIAKQVNVPVQLIWSREDDTRNDYYRPASLVQFKAGLDENGRLDTWGVKRAGPNIMPYLLDDMVDAMMPGFIPDGMADWISKRGYGVFDGLTIDHASIEGLFEDYDVPNKEARHVTVDPGIRVGYWRSVGHSFSGFSKESFMDELALAAGEDPVALRLAHLNNNPRLQRVVKKVAQKAGWGKPLPPNHFHGIAAHASFSSFVAEIAEVSVEHGQIKIHKVTCIIDCGLVVNPDNVIAQMEGGIIYGITAALHGDITIKDGAVQQSNFHDYPMLRINESPEIDVHIIESNEDPTGVGEPGLPPIAAAIGNAVFAATGQRLRSLPLKLA